ncbi:transporter substrate-binding domain-containing protein [Pimelobacter simplex]|uniref:Amino acid ABC transporter substrate-binding protein n=1 Tax=Nocardioides simplex TaxID=2045 RepID=A0A0A1DR80_NOCSI|nr:ABC transporter substrate-binding protein [Pimelobacter simplex]AIY19879.2 extracellular solute-binding protein, family 3 [Pimelobacter simplex]KAB2807540.1 amino acid ABC transporter substrate-binding protein [Pimelobacter simplex]MCG8151555.1 transporter substrate-binding domain-containing protein [Pimelobacter simplex]SFM47293.1 amino acid ABC transporter substrate-binding protein, PAAT family [Pimelobacter simplex]GEB13262.1 basic amino acid ABC transporter substrate-binding protein [Pi
MRRTRILALGIAGLTTLALGACGSEDSKSSTGADIVTKGTLTVCSDVPYPPFEDFDKSSPTGFKGFDVDIVSEVAKRLDLKLKIQDSSFDALQSGQALAAGQCDLAASAMTITDDRKKNLDFSDGYYDSKQSLLVPADSKIAAIGDLDGVKVGVQQGTTGKTYTEENAKGADIITFPSDAEMFQAIKAGQVQALLQDLPVNLDHTRDGKFKIVEQYDTSEEYGFAMKKGNSQLVDDVDGALEEMHKDGTYDTIYAKYFTTEN